MFKKISDKRIRAINSDSCLTAYQKSMLKKYVDDDCRFNDLLQLYRAFNADSRVGRVIGIDGKVIDDGIDSGFSVSMFEKRK